ncbi:YdcF family protein [Geomicrobium sp. JSM 1781026]|uniref:YdcF family protein n=1 Tax=Geomicrobium sp. JSM 1781026 TaxID=3344580 RepID=UPI0035BFD8D9
MIRPQLIEQMTNFIFVETKVSHADVILIPGADHRQLMETAALIYKRGLAPFILPSGGFNTRLQTTEWEYLRQIGLAYGIPDARILKEDRATHTLDNARSSYQVLQREQISVKAVLIVCKACHARRVLCSYQSVFPAETTFFISPCVDRFGITRGNWFQSAVGIERTMAEVSKIEKYFGLSMDNSR